MRPINLLPAKAKQRAAARRRRSLWVVLGVLYLVILALITIWWEGKITDKEEDLAAQQAVVDTLRAEVAQLADLQQLQENYEAQRAIIQEILAGDVAWGRLLNDFGRLIPPRVWMTSFSGAASADAVAVGQLSVTGTAFDYPDVASWLRSLDSANFPGVGASWVSSASASQIGAIDIVDFSSSVSLSPEALSERVSTRIPEIP